MKTMDNINKIIQDLGIISYAFFLFLVYFTLTSVKEVMTKLKNKIWLWIARGKIIEENEKIDKRIDLKIKPLLQIAKNNEENIEKISKNIALREEGLRSHHKQIRHIVGQKKQEAVLHELLNSIEALDKKISNYEK